MKFSLKGLAKYNKSNISPIFGESNELIEEHEYSKPKRPNNTADKTELIEKFKKEGTKMAEIGNPELAIKSFEEAIKLSTQDSTVYEMKSQIHLTLNQIFPAIAEAHKSIELSPTWGTAYQTLARAQLGRGEVELALKNFQKCLHLEPDNNEARKEDLPWCLELVRQKKILDARVKFQSEMALEMSADIGEMENKEFVGTERNEENVEPKN